MKKPLLPAAFTLALTTVAALALEARTWTLIDGRTFEAELLKVQGEMVSVRSPKDGKTYQIKSGQLSRGDLDYLKEFAPAAPTTGFAPAPGAKPATARNPAKDAKIDTKTFVKGGTFSVPGASFEILETPHFLIMTNGKIKPQDTAENAERLWFDMAFFHPGFTDKWRDIRMAIFICEESQSYGALGDWYMSMLREAKQDQAAHEISSTWGRSDGGTIQMSTEAAEQHKVFREARVFRADTDEKKKNSFKSGQVWTPFRTHCIASDLLRIQVGYPQQFGAEGYFAILAGHAYYKEIALCGQAVTGMLGYGGDSKGFDANKDWADELKKLLRRAKTPPTLGALYQVTRESMKPEDAALAYAFARYLQSTEPRITAFAKLAEQIDASNQIPEPADLAKLYGFESEKAMEADWLAWMKSGSFR